MNKKYFVDALIFRLNEAGHETYQALNDADTLIVKTALTIASTEAVTVVANDTDVLVLLIYPFKITMSDIFLHSEGSKKVGATNKVSVSVRALQNSIGENVSQIILALHAISGCDSTSSLFGIGKGKALKKLSGSKEAMQLCTVLTDKNATHDEVNTAGLQTLSLLYGGKTSESLNHLRYVMYMNCAASSTLQPHPERLPPTENASRYHVYRAHLQIVQWETLMSCDLKAEEWGWKLTDGRFSPILTDQPAAPDDILKIIRCKCNAQLPHPCSTQLCSCVKHGLACVAACKNCTGELCGNIDRLESNTMTST